MNIYFSHRRTIERFVKTVLPGLGCSRHVLGTEFTSVSPSAAEVVDFTGRAAVALILGAAVGVERQ